MSHDRGCWKCHADTMVEKAACAKRRGPACVKYPIFYETNGVRRLWCDMDGVLADFSRGYMEAFGKFRERHSGWDDVRSVKHFFRNLHPMPDMRVLWDAIGPHRPNVLTGVPSSINAADNDKVHWIHQHIGYIPVVCCRAKDKHFFCKPGDVLIDDNTEPVARQAWESAGGIYILHHDAERTIRALQAVDFIK